MFNIHTTEKYGIVLSKKLNMNFNCTNLRKKYRIILFSSIYVISERLIAPSVILVNQACLNWFRQNWFYRQRTFIFFSPFFRSDNLWQTPFLFSISQAALFPPLGPSKLNPTRCRLHFRRRKVHFSKYPQLSLLLGASKGEKETLIFSFICGELNKFGHRFG